MRLIRFLSRIDNTTSSISMILHSLSHKDDVAHLLAQRTIHQHSTPLFRFKFDEQRPLNDQKNSSVSE